MVYEKRIVWTEDCKLLNKLHFVDNKTEIMQHVLKCSEIPSFLNI